MVGNSGVVGYMRMKVVQFLAFSMVFLACLPNENSHEQLQITVFAAASLTDMFTMAANVFENHEPDTQIDLNFAGTALLRIQLEHGAVADVFASANGRQMLLAQAAGLVKDTPSVFATNELVLIAKADGPVQVMRDLAKPGIRLVVALPEIPVGSYTEQFLEALETSSEYGPEFVLAIRKNIVSLEGNVRLVASKVLLGEADAGFVYSTDVQNQKTIRIVDIPQGFKVGTEYWIAVTHKTSNPSLGTKFIEFLKSDEWQLAIEDQGFGRSPE